MMLPKLFPLRCQSLWTTLNPRAERSFVAGSWLALSLLLNSAGCSALQSKRMNDLAAAVRPDHQPSHHRQWKSEQAVLPIAKVSKSGVTIRNVRQARWVSEEEKQIRHRDWSFRWEQIVGVDFVIVPFQSMPTLAHTMLSFRLDDGRALGVSVEARQELHETYQPLAGAARQYELIYVIADEEDLFGLRANVRRDDIYLFPSKASPEQAAELLRDILERANQLAAEPEFYDSLTNNCSTNLVTHVERVIGDQLSSSWREQIPGKSSDRLAYDLGLLETDLSYSQARATAWISGRVRQYLGEADFSLKIRKETTTSRVTSAVKRDP